MIEALSRIEALLLKRNGLTVAAITKDPECTAYSGCSFQLGDRNVTFREAKSTPKKIGQFVTLWKRNHQQQTEPFNVTDGFDFYMIATGQQHRFGFFLFPGAALRDMQILTTHDKEGKRGFRVYADWDTPQNRQAEKTKAWQTRYFIDLTHITHPTCEKLHSIINGY